MNDAGPGEGSRPLREEELLSVALAAALAGRSVRTIRRAYRSGTLLAYRDGNGRGVRIRYGDLRRWMMAASAAAPAQEDEGPQLLSPLQRLGMDGKLTTGDASENLALLNAARARQRRGDAPGGGAGRRAASSAAAPRA